MKTPLYTTVYRIEHPENGFGPYRSMLTDDDLLERMREKHSAYVSPAHPVPQKDGIAPAVMEAGNMLSAFKNMTQLRAWFGEFVGPLLKDGFKVVKYYVPTAMVHMGRHQVVFDRKKSVISTPVKLKP